MSLSSFIAIFSPFPNFLLLYHLRSRNAVPFPFSFHPSFLPSVIFDPPRMYHIKKEEFDT